MRILKLTMNNTKYSGWTDGEIENKIIHVLRKSGITVEEAVWVETPSFFVTLDAQHQIELLQRLDDIDHTIGHELIEELKDKVTKNKVTQEDLDFIDVL